MAPAAQVRHSYQERRNRGECGIVGLLVMEVERDEKQSVSLHLYLSLSFCDGCKAVDHAPDLSVFLIKILYLKTQGKKRLESTQ